MAMFFLITNPNKQIRIKQGAELYKHTITPLTFFMVKEIIADL